MDEICGNPASASMVAWYLFNNPASRIAFCPDHINESYPEWPLPGVSWDDILTYRDLTEEILSVLINKGILRDNGIRYQDEEDPEVYLKDIKNIWAE
ncbi:hypothetical protein EHQ52_15400 [Leptospira koniambonensis]|uniref:Uncharacterized protein n=1 Tax=Leptospira koniambonensis TaxID=2484950 RepID=A0A4R9J3J3_9LEPT|nr:hypothetical protein [Leptospira koniambonensis]TGL31321.1 hypothetical protein EHQ52_15400 [Leptospira koniambonensis]